MCKFKPGDVFKVSRNGVRGKIIRIMWNSIYSYEEYLIEWEGQPGSYINYAVDDGDSHWELVSSTHTVISNGTGWVPYNPSEMEDGYIGKVKTCQHDFKLYQGFTDTFEYCVHCDEKKR